VARALIALAALAVVLPAAAAVPPSSPLAKRFAYEGSSAFRDNGVADSRDGIVVRDLSLGRQQAYLVLPAGGGPFPTVVWSPGLNGTRDDQLEDARDLAKQGVAGLTVSRPRDGITCTKRDPGLVVAGVIFTRRVLDALSARPDVDAGRLGYVGFSWGAELGGILAGVDARPKAVVLDSATPYISRVNASFCRGGSSYAPVVRALHALDPVRFVPHAAPTQLLIQSGTLDRLRPRPEVQELHRAASSPKVTRWYVARHPLNERAFSDRTAFLLEQLR
jgi:dienelactone hydrolase